ncbi:coniferyl-aldehyde dehydrogenase [Roseovarius pacificus]|uniref:Aldehyde dehydrogenase n=1 Tax=Roseovarius pacificus TaxID=337701 RepID=A0A1M7HGD3_9RHOB|nr:coniferyl aldehyde dehydrogenase [Roseovarius pacificus]GGO58459.1 aldehyde dehydrogenase [Roseovarius pacificus]SHM27498.1 coniferyl-aldehyde dehydrogenase [Roseovarius pacificus]
MSAKTDPLPADRPGNFESFAGQHELSAILDRQRAAFLANGPPDARQRKDNLARLRAAVLAQRSELADAINADFGSRSRYETEIMEVVPVIQAIDYYRKKLRRFMKPERRHVALPYRFGRAYVELQPKGVIGIMAPWNYPFSLVMVPLITALAAGNRAMIKPSELTPRTGEVIGRMLAAVFAPEDVAVVLGGAEVGAAFSELAFDHILFTGSTQVGRKVMRAASENLVPLTLELGGKSPAVIARGAVNRQTVSSVAFGKLANGGQTCVAPDYALVHANDLDAFIAAFSDAAAHLYPGGPDNRDYASIINERHFERLHRLLDDARTRGARLIEIGVGPNRAPKRPYTIVPTLVIGADDNTGVMTEEIFGPILPVRTYQTMDEAIAYINARPRPLALYYFGERNADCAKLLKRTTSGNVGINNTLLHVAIDDLPFGGVGPSGMGAYHGIEGFRSMSHAKGVFIQARWNLPGLLRPPYRKVADLAISLILGKRRASK